MRGTAARPYADLSVSRVLWTLVSALTGHCWGLGIVIIVLSSDPSSPFIGTDQSLMDLFYLEGAWSCKDLPRKCFHFSQRWHEVFVWSERKLLSGLKEAGVLRGMNERVSWFTPGELMWTVWVTLIWAEIPCTGHWPPLGLRNRPHLAESRECAAAC